MHIYGVLILAIIFGGNEAEFKKRYAKPDPYVHERVASLAQLIDLVSGHGVEKDASQLEERVEDSSKVQQFDQDYNITYEKDSSNILKKIMSLIQSNYDAQKAHETLGARLHVLSNPEVLAEYRDNLRKMMSQRKNAFFQFYASSKEKPIANDDIAATKNIEDSIENDIQIQKKSYDGGNIDKFDEINDDDLKDKIKNTADNDDFKQDNAWDVVTKEYNWEDKPKTKKNGGKKQQNNFKDIDFDDDSNKKETKQKKYDDWDKKIEKPKKSYDDWPKEDNYKQKPYKKKWDSGERKKPIRQKSKDFDRSYERPKNNKKKIKNYDDSNERPKKQEVTLYKVTTYRTTKKWKKEPKVDRNNDDYDKPKPKKSRDSYNAGNSNSNSNSGFFGRTPIPYAGKKRIYADK